VRGAPHDSGPTCLPCRSFGIDGNSGEIRDMKEAGVWEPYQVKVRQEGAVLALAAAPRRLRLWLRLCAPPAACPLRPVPCALHLHLGCAQLYPASGARPGKRAGRLALKPHPRALCPQAQTIKTAIESATMLLRIDDIVSGMSKRDKGSGPSQPSGGREVEDHDNVDSERMLAE
jgi:hypothetical protein